jgi:1,2-diacylglycerol-3-alpha-glucose alpha-1,2-glucosyltransferase
MYGNKKPYVVKRNENQMRVCMVTGLPQLKKIFSYINAGGMGTQVPILAKKLGEKDVTVSVDERTDCDIIHLHNPMPNFLFLIKKYKKLGKKIVIHARHIPELVKGGFKYGSIIYPFFHRYSTFFYNLADAVICATPYVQKWMEDNGVTSPTYVIPNGVDCSFFQPSREMRDRFREKYGLTTELVIFSVGLIIPRKGIHDFVDVAKECDDKTFMWIGTSEKTTKKVGVRFPDNVIHIPHIPFNEMPYAYNGGDIFFFPTYAESYGNVLVEAAACKKSIVVRDIEIYSKWFSHKKNCLKGKNVSDFIENIEMLANDDMLQERISQGAYGMATDHDIDKTITSLIGVYEELSGK